MKFLLDPMDATGRYPFVYKRADETDVRRTFARVIAEQEAKRRDQFQRNVSNDRKTEVDCAIARIAGL